MQASSVVYIVKNEVDHILWGVYQDDMQLCLSVGNSRAGGSVIVELVYVTRVSTFNFGLIADCTYSMDNRSQSS